MPAVSYVSGIGTLQIKWAGKLFLLEDYSKVVNFLPKIVLHTDDPPGPVVEACHHTSLHIGHVIAANMSEPQTSKLNCSYLYIPRGQNMVY